MWPFTKQEEKKKVETVAFSDILTGLQSAISQVQDMLQNSQLENLANFWYSDGQAVSQPVKIGDKTINVPLLTLVPHSQLAMDTVKVDFSTRVSSIVPNTSYDLLKAGNLMGCEKSSKALSHADMQVTMEGANTGEDVMNVTITFKIKDTPEAVSRLLDEYNKQI